MKKIYSILACFAILFTGCSSDDDNGTDYSEAIIGKWYQTAYLNSDKYFTSQENGTYIQFNSDGTFTFFLGGIFEETTTGTYSFVFDTHIELKIDGRTINPTVSIDEYDSNEAVFTFTLLHSGTYKVKRK